MKAVVTTICSVGVLLLSFIVAAEYIRTTQRNMEKIQAVFELGDVHVTDVSWHSINNVTGREDRRMELPTQDATYRVEGAFKVPSGFLPTQGTPATPAGVETLRDIPATGWLQDEAFQERLLKRKDLPVRLYFSPESGWVVFTID